MLSAENKINRWDLASLLLRRYSVFWLDGDNNIYAFYDYIQSIAITYQYCCFACQVPSVILLTHPVTTAHSVFRTINAAFKSYRISNIWFIFSLNRILIWYEYVVLPVYETPLWRKDDLAIVLSPYWDFLYWYEISISNQGTGSYIYLSIFCYYTIGTKRGI